MYQVLFGDPWGFSIQDCEGLRSKVFSHPADAQSGAFAVPCALLGGMRCLDRDADKYGPRVWPVLKRYITFPIFYSQSLSMAPDPHFISKEQAVSALIQTDEDKKFLPQNPERTPFSSDKEIAVYKAILGGIPNIAFVVRPAGASLAGVLSQADGLVSLAYDSTGQLAAITKALKEPTILNEASSSTKGLGDFCGWLDSHQDSLRHLETQHKPLQRQASNYLINKQQVQTPLIAQTTPSETTLFTRMGLAIDQLEWERPDIRLLALAIDTYLMICYQMLVVVYARRARLAKGTPKWPRMQGDAYEEARVYRRVLDQKIKWWIGKLEALKKLRIDQVSKIEVVEPMQLMIPDARILPSTSKECQRKHWKKHKSECKLFANLITKLSPESDRRQRVVKAWFNHNAWVLTDILQDALLPHPRVSSTAAASFTSHIMVFRVAEEPKGSRSGKIAIQKAFLTPLAMLRNRFANSADYERSMQDDRDLAADLEAKEGCQFHLLYLLIRCEDPDENHLLNEIVRVPIPQVLVDRARYTYLDESWQERLRQHFHLSDNTPLADSDDEYDELAEIRSGTPWDGLSVVFFLPC
ncbi:hypothetical protein FRC00_005247 [Tulasnella sp. 408]|nr:hypothetical protein FRC00_005247 [Tulasnella sp. 408]